MKAEFDYIDSIFEFKGLWDIPSKCGIKIVKKAGMGIAILTELYKENTGTSVTKWCAPLADQICQSFDINPQELVFIEHTPEMKSKLSFYDETFTKVDFDRVDEKFANPKWTKLSKKEADELMKQ